MSIKEFQTRAIGDLAMPKTLEKLYYFDDKYIGETYSKGFCLAVEDPHTTHEWEENQIAAYKKQIKTFALADGTGSLYAFWLRDGETDLENAPIVCFGSEYDVRIVAKNLQELLVLLTFDEEIVEGSAFRFDDERSENHDVFVQWLKDEFTLEPVGNFRAVGKSSYSLDVEKIIADAQKCFQNEFMQWHEQFEKIECTFNDA